MKLHNEDIVAEDRVFDVSANRGFGKVKRVSDTNIDVEYKRSLITYNTNGVQSGRMECTLFWNRPLIIKPTKSDVLWSVKQDLVTNFLDAVLKYKELS